MDSVAMWELGGKAAVCFEWRQTNTGWLLNQFGTTVVPPTPESTAHQIRDLPSSERHGDTLECFGRAAARSDVLVESGDAELAP